MGMELLNQLIVVFALSIAVFFVFLKFKIPAIVGFLLTGLIAGPYGLKIIENNYSVETLAEIGIVLLLFTIGIEFSFDNLIRIKRSVLVGGSLQVFLTILVSFIISRIVGITIAQSIFIGFLVSLSSTAIVLKIIQDRAEIDSPHGRTTFGILIFQDIIVVPMMLIIPLLAGVNQNGSQDITILILKGLAILLMTIVGAKWVVPYILFQITKTKNRELFLLTIIVICFSVAWLTYSMGLSLALGAFLAGLIISESEYSHEALGNVLPFRDVFTSLFFISIGMMLNINILFSRPILIILLALGVIIIKILVAGAATLLMGFPLRTAILVGMKLGQVGEFSFILAKVGNSYGIIDQNALQIFIAISIITMATTPFIIRASLRVADAVATLPLPDRLRVGLINEQEAKKKGKENHAIIIGFGLNGKNLAKTSEKAEIPYLVIEMNPQIIRRERKKGYPIIHGDATHDAVLEFSGVKNAKVVVIAISDTIATRKITKLVRKINPSVHIIVRTRYVEEVKQLYKLGANEVIPEEFETSIEIFTKVLETYQISRYDIDRYVEEARADGYKLFTNVKGNNV